MSQIISHQRARANLSAFGWEMVRQGKAWYSRDLRHVIYQAGDLYKWRPCRSTW